VNATRRNSQTDAIRLCLVLHGTMNPLTVLFAVSPPSVS